MWKAFFRAVRRKEYRLSTAFWATLAATVFYTVWPLDAIPDILFPVVGYLDDLGLWGIVSLLLTREKRHWEATLSGKPAIDVAWKDAAGDTTEDGVR